MRLHKSQRSKQAEAICKRLIKRRGWSKGTPKISDIPVYVIERKTNSVNQENAWGIYYPWKHIILYHGSKASRRQKYVVLVHELAHHIDQCVTARRYRIRAHGETFQKIFWNTLKRGLWKHAMQPRFLKGGSRHRPEFQPNKKEVSNDRE